MSSYGAACSGCRNRREYVVRVLIKARLRPLRLVLPILQASLSLLVSWSGSSEGLETARHYIDNCVARLVDRLVEQVVDGMTVDVAVNIMEACPRPRHMLCCR